MTPPSSAVLSPLTTTAAAIAPLKIALIDPSLFTIPYDAKLADALGGLGHAVTVYGEARAPGDKPSELQSLRGLFYPELLDLRSRRWPRPALRIAKGALHMRAMRRLLDELRRTRPERYPFSVDPTTGGRSTISGGFAPIGADCADRA